MRTLPIVLAATTILFPLHAIAQDPMSGASPEGWNYSVGAGVLVAPSYLGDDSYQVMAVPNVRVTYEDVFFASMQEGAGYNLIHTDQWRAGPLARYDFGRDEDGDSAFRVSGDKTDDLRGLGDVDGSFEIGGFVEYTLDSFSGTLEVLQAMDGHDGLVGTASLEYSGMTSVMGKPAKYSFGPEIKFADSHYHAAYFGVDARQSAASGLAQYSADAGILSYGVGGSAIIPMTDTISAVAFMRYDRLGEEAADSSLVKKSGSDHQGSAGLFLNYSF